MISRYFAKDGKAIVLLIRSVAFPRPRCCRNRGLLKVFIDVLFELLGFQKQKGFDILA